MEYTEDQGDHIFKIVSPVIEAMGYTIVELSSAKVSDDLHIHLIIHSPGGIGIDDCTKVHRTIQKRIEILTGDRYFYLEVSSPGITRNLKRANEFSVFTGKAVKLLLENESEWIKGIILESNKIEVKIQTSDELKWIPYSEIRKAKLDFSGEV